jgi:hypothetical protein
MNDSERTFNDLAPNEPNAPSTYERAISGEEDRGFGGARKAEVAQNPTSSGFNTSFGLEKRGPLDPVRRQISARMTDSTVGSGRARIFLNEGRAEQALQHGWVHMSSNAHDQLRLSVGCLAGRTSEIHRLRWRPNVQRDRPIHIQIERLAWLELNPARIDDLGGQSIHVGAHGRGPFY